MSRWLILGFLFLSGCVSAIDADCIKQCEAVCEPHKGVQKIVTLGGPTCRCMDGLEISGCGVPATITLQFQK